MYQILRNYFCVSFCEMDFLENLLDFELCVCVKLTIKRKGCVYTAAVD